MKKKSDSLGNACCHGTSSCASSSIGRRDFIKASGLTAAMLMAGRSPVMAGPFTKEDFEQIIPSDKKLSEEWMASLYARGEALSATGEDLKFIGMPINGICTGVLAQRVSVALQCGNRPPGSGAESPWTTSSDGIHFRGFQ